MKRRTMLRALASVGALGLWAPLLAACEVERRQAPAVTAAPTPVAGTPGDAAVGTPQPTGPSATRRTSVARVAFIKTNDRAAGVRRALDIVGTDFAKGKNVFLKPNFNSADPPPGSTHIAVLRALLQRLHEAGAQAITVGDRSGMGDTRTVMEQLGIFHLARELDFQVLVLNELPAAEWETVRVPGSHWQQDFAFPKPALAADAIVQTCCLKTHRFGGHFTLSLKNSVGFAAKRVPGHGHDYMLELHSSPHQRRMIAEINAAYRPALVVLDGVEAFVDGGPDQGTRVAAQVVLAGEDRVAIDAVGVAILRHFGTTPEVSRGPIFGLEQIARVVELGLGVSGPEQIELVTDDAESAAYAAQIEKVLQQG